MARSRSGTDAKEPLRIPPRDGGEEAFDGVDPGGGGWREVENPARMIGQPFEHIGLFVGGVVVDDGVDDFADRYGALDGVEEADELLMAMPAHAAPNHGPVENVERGEQRRRSVALVIVGHRPAFAGLDRQARLGAVERLDLALLVDGDDDGVLGRVHVKADDVLDLLDEIGIVGALERAQAMGLRSMRFPQALNGAQADATALAMARPVQCVASPGGSEQVSCRSGDDLQGQRRATGLARFVAQQAVDALFGIAHLPTPHRRSADAGAARNFRHRQPFGREQNDLSALNMLASAIAVGNRGEQTLAISGMEREDADSLGHSARLAHHRQLVNLPSVSVH